MHIRNASVGTDTNMRYLSVCSGIEAATQGWQPLGWQAAAFAEIEAFPCAVLAHHYPEVPNLGDITAFKGWPDLSVDLLVGGTPCQSFSIAGFREGLADPRGNLALVYLAIADRYRPEWLVWENVPGVLSSSGGRDFGAFLGGMAELGYGFAYRVLDAQFVRVDLFGRAVPQRRRRVFVVGNSRNWRRAAAVLFEPESLSWDSPPRRKASQRTAGTITTSSARRGGVPQADATDSLIAFGGNDTTGPIDVATARNAHGGPHGRLDFESETFVVAGTLGVRSADHPSGIKSEADFLVPVVAAPLTRGAESAGKGGYAGRRQEDDVNLVAFDCKAGGNTGFSIGEVPGALRGEGFGGGHAAVAFDMRGREGGSQFEGPHDTANVRAASGGSSRSYIAQQWAVRRLTPRECERLQGFPDDFTAITHRRKLAADGNRYKALGNSMACNVLRWLGRRIDMVRRED